MILMSEHETSRCPPPQQEEEGQAVTVGGGRKKRRHDGYRLSSKINRLLYFSGLDKELCVCGRIEMTSLATVNVLSSSVAKALLSLSLSFGCIFTKELFLFSHTPSHIKIEFGHHHHEKQPFSGDVM